MSYKIPWAGKSLEKYIPHEGEAEEDQLRINILLTILESANDDEMREVLRTFSRNLISTTLTPHAVATKTSKGTKKIEQLGSPEKMRDFRNQVRAMIAFTHKHPRTIASAETNFSRDIELIPLRNVLTDSFFLHQLTSGSTLGSLESPRRVSPIVQVAQFLNTPITDLVLISRETDYSMVQRAINELAIIGIAVDMKVPKQFKEEVALSELLEGRTCAALSKRGIRTLSELLRLSITDLRVHGFAAGSTQRVIMPLAEQGLLLQDAFRDPFAPPAILLESR